MIYILDTDVFTLAYRSSHGLRDRIAKEQQHHTVLISVITWMEVLRGRMDSVLKAADSSQLLRAVQMLRSSEAFLATFNVLDFDITAAQHFDRLRNEKQARKAGRNDLLIACIALANRATVVTRNTRDFANVPGIQLEDWSA